MQVPPLQLSAIGRGRNSRLSSISSSSSANNTNSWLNYSRNRPRNVKGDAWANHVAKELQTYSGDKEYQCRAQFGILGERLDCGPTPLNPKITVNIFDEYRDVVLGSDEDRNWLLPVKDSLKQYYHAKIGQPGQSGGRKRSTQKRTRKGSKRASRRRH